MDEILPQEIEVRYIIPAIRGSLAKSMVEHFNIPQKQAAQLLGLSEGAISQYLHGKRGHEVKFSKDIQQHIQQSAKKIIENKEKVTQELIKLSHSPEIKKVMCQLHRKSSKELKDCNICFENEPIELRI